MEHLQYFTDRKRQIAAFEALWQAQTRWAIVFSGMSGNGKSTLIDWLIAHKCQPHQITALKIDLYSGLDPATMLDRLAQLLPSQAANRYRAGRAPINQAYHRDLAEALKAARQIIAELKASQGGQISQSQIQIDTGQAESLKALRRSCYQQLTDLLEAELDHLSPERAVIFLDTYERAQESSLDEEISWLWQVLETVHTANPKLRVVVGSRVDLTYQPAQAWRTHRPLDTFSRADSDTFLSTWSQGAISTVLQEAIFELAQGHPMLTEMAAELWRDGQQAGRPLTLAELRAGLQHRSAEEWLYGRIISRLEALGNPRLVAAIRYGPLLRQFTLRSLNAILPEAIERLDDRLFRRLTGYAFVKKVSPGWTFHELMRETQVAYLAEQDDPEVEACHRRADQFFQAQAEATGDPEAARNILYHACFLDPSGLFETWLDETFQAQLAGDRLWWDELLKVLEAPAQYNRLPQIERGTLIRQRGLWHVRDYNMQAALQSYQQALDLFRQVGDRLGEANTLLAMADAARDQEAWSKSWSLYEQTIHLYQTIGDNYSQARVHYRLGDWHAAQGQSAEAATRYRQAITIWSDIGLGNLVEQILKPRLQAVTEQKSYSNPSSF